MLAIEATEKQCRVCKEVYPLEYFHRKSSGKGGRDTICPACKAAYEHERQKEKRESSKIGGMVGSYSPENPWHDVACACLMCAADDWHVVQRTGHYKRVKNHSEHRRQEILLQCYPDAMHELLTFFWSDWFECLCDLAGFDPEWMRKQLEVPKLLV